MALLVILGGVAFGLSEELGLDLENEFDETEPFGPRVMGVLYIFGGLLSLVVHIVPFFLRRGRAAWIYGIVVLAFAIMSCCLVGIPLLIFWVLDRNRLWHGA